MAFSSQEIGKRRLFLMRLPWGGEVDSTTNLLTISTGAIATMGTLTIGGAASTTITSVVGPGSGGLVKTGAGTLTLSASNGYTGPTIVNTGKLKDGGTGALPAATALTVQGTGIFDLAGVPQAVDSLSDGGVDTGIVTNSGAAATLTDNDSGMDAFSGLIGGALALTMNGPGRLTLSGPNTYTGGTVISTGGTVQLGNGGTSGALGSGPVTNSGSLVFDLSSGTVSNLLRGTGSITQHSDATTTLRNASDSFSGPTIISGTLKLGIAISLTSNVTDNGTLDLSGFNLTIGALSGAASGIVTTSVAGAKTMTVGNGGSSGAFSGVIQDGSGTLSLTKLGLGSQVISNVPYYSGLTTISAGALVGWPSTTVNVAASATLDLAGSTDVVLTSLTGSGTVTNSSATTSTLAMDNSSADTISGTLTGNLGLTPGGAGVVTLSGANTYTGMTRIFGTLELGANNAIPSTSDVYNGATLDLHGFNDTIGALSGGNGLITSNVGGAVTLTVGATGDSGSYPGQIENGSGTVSLEKIGAGVEVLSSPFNDYTGTTVVNQGTLEVDGSIQSPVTVASGATLQGSGRIAANVSNSGVVVPGTSAVPGTLTITGSYTQNASGNLDIFIGGGSAGQYGVLAVGTASLNGTLSADLINNYNPASGRQLEFEFITFSSESGNFTSQSLPSPSWILVLDATYGYLELP